MTRQLTARDLFDGQATSLKLKWIAGRAGGERLLEPITAKYPGMALVGHLNFVHPNRVQVLGDGEIDHIDNLNPQERERALKIMFGAARTAIVIVANGERVPPDLIKAADTG